MDYEKYEYDALKRILGIEIEQYKRLQEITHDTEVALTKLMKKNKRMAYITIAIYIGACVFNLCCAVYWIMKIYHHG